MIFIIKGFRTIVSIFTVISSVSADISSGLQVFVELGTYTELRTTSFICSDSVCHNRVQVLSIPVLLFAGNQD